MTKTEMIDAMLSSYSFTEEEKNFLEHEKEMISRKRPSVRKPSPRQVANIALSKDIVAEMVHGNSYLVGDMIAKFKCMPPDANCQRITFIMTNLVAEGKVNRAIVDGKAEYSLV